MKKSMKPPLLNSYILYTSSGLTFLFKVLLLGYYTGYKSVTFVKSGNIFGALLALICPVILLSWFSYH